MGSRCDSLPIVTMDCFNKIWDANFPHVKLPKFTAVQTKCNTCSILDVCAEECTTKEQKAEVRVLRKLHASMYRKQRKWYHRTREMAMREPDLYISCIGDGMAQVHNCLPSYSKSGTSTAPMVFDTHYQGMITHGKRFTIFRSFGNVGKGTNVAVYSWLRHLEIEYRRDGKLPDTLFQQIDGGGENANEITIGMAELLVHWGLTKRVIITRLPVGHTHEDIDGMFGVIWQHNKMFNILTPQKQAFLTRKAFAHRIAKGFEVEVEDVFAVPDYRKYITPNSWLKRVFKTTKDEPYTQLQFTVEKVPVSEHFPLGVRTMYKAYATDSAIEIIRKGIVPFIVPPRSTIGLMALRVDSYNRPTSDDNNGGPEGARVMNNLPRDPLQVAAFKPIKVKEGKNTVQVDAKTYLDKMVYAMQGQHGEDTAIGRQWRNFAALFPKGSAAEYIETPGNKYQVPFKEFFDRTAAVAISSADSSDEPSGDAPPLDDAVGHGPESGLLRGFSTACATWGQQGKGFTGIGMRAVARARELYPGQGLSALHFVAEPVRDGPGAPKNKKKKGKAYKYWTNYALKFELEKRRLSCSGLKAELIARLQASDEENLIPGAVEGQENEDGEEEGANDEGDDVRNEEPIGIGEAIIGGDDSSDTGSECSSLDPVSNTVNDENKNRNNGSDDEESDDEDS